MKTLAEQMAVYGAYHRNPWNRLTHFIGVPVIIFAILIPMSRPSVSLGEWEISLAVLVVVLLLLYYIALDWRLGSVMVPVFGGLLFCGDWVATTHSAFAGWTVFTIAFIGGWAVQLLGHVFEGRRPALVDNIWQIFVAPIFLAAEVFFMCGARAELRSEVQARISRTTR